MKDKQLGNADQPGSAPYLLRLPAVLKMTGLGRSTLYRLIAEGAFPPPVKLAKRAVAWRQEEVQQWVDTRARAAHRQGPEVWATDSARDPSEARVDSSRGGSFA